MRRFLVLILLLMVSLAASAGNKGKFGAGVGVTTGSTDLVGRYYASDNLAVRLRFNFLSVSNGASTSDFGVGGGLEYHWAANKTSPYIVGEVTYRSLESFGDITRFNVFGGWGAEYWWDEHFSMSGDAGVNFTSQSNGADVTTFGTLRTAIRFLYYF